MAQIDETQFYICGQHGNMLNHRGNVYSNLIPIKKIVYMEEKKKDPNFAIIVAHLDIGMGVLYYIV